MYAIVEDSGTQIRVAEGDEFEIDLREGAEAGSEIVFDRVLLISFGEGEPTIGLPYVEGASVKAEVLEQFKADKVTSIKFKRRKGYRRNKGHRQPYLQVRVTGISACGDPREFFALTVCPPTPSAGQSRGRCSFCLKPF